MITKPIVLDETFSAKLTDIHGDLTDIALALGTKSTLDSWADIQYEVRKGVIDRHLEPADQLLVELDETVAAEVSGTGITAATVDKDTFFAEHGTHVGHFYFVYDGATWELNGNVVDLDDYGITPTGTPDSGDMIIVSVAGTGKEFDVQGIDEEIAIHDDRAHVLTLQMHKLLARYVFDPPQYLYVIRAEDWPSGLPAGTYNIVLDHAAHNGSTTEDTTVKFTTTQVVPVGGGIRHTEIGKWRAEYSKATMLSGTFITYGADTVTVIEQNLATTEGSTGTNLGTATAKDYQYHDADHPAMNYTTRQMHGSNRWSTSFIRQLLNSEQSTFSFTPATIFSRDADLSPAPSGFLYEIDPELRAVMTKIRKRYALSSVDAEGSTTSYEDVEDFITLDTYMDIFGGANHGVYEGPVNSRGEVTRKTPTALWANVTDNADRIKYDTSNVARYWATSSIDAVNDNCDFVYEISNAGESSYSFAGVDRGIAPCVHIA